jgi:hypothetical protein
MTTFLLVALASIIGYHIGRKVGITYAMMRMQGIIDDMQQIQMFLKEKQQTWNEDNL